MYFVDKGKIEETLAYLEDLSALSVPSTVASIQEKLALERTVQLIIETMLDSGNSMIDGFIMRDPGSYNDIIDILVDEKVVPEEHADAYKDVIALRKQLTADYLAIDHAILIRKLNEHHTALLAFVEHTRSYLANETNTATTFKK